MVLQVSKLDAKTMRNVFGMQQLELKHCELSSLNYPYYFQASKPYLLECIQVPFQNIFSLRYSGMHN